MRMYAVMFIPDTGLLYENGKFYDGQMKEVPWGQTLHVYPSFRRATKAKEAILSKYPERYRRGSLVVLNVELIEHEDLLPVEEFV